MSGPSTGYWAWMAWTLLARSGRISLVLSLMVVASVGVMIFLSAMCVGINDAMVRNSVSLFSGHVLGEDIPASASPESLAGPGTAAVLRRVAEPGVLQGPSGAEPMLLVSVDPAGEQARTALPAKVEAGRYIEPGTSSVLVGRATAERIGAEPGGTVAFRAGPDAAVITLTVAGIFRTGFDRLDQGTAFCPFGAVPIKAKTWSAAVFLKSGVDAVKAAEALNERLPGPARFKPWTETMPDLKELVDLNYVSMGVVLALVFGVVSLGVGCAFVIFILKNIREFGIMTTMGVTSGEMARLIVLEVALMSLAASAAGVALGGLGTLAASRFGIDLSALTAHNRYFMVSAIIRPRLTPFSLLLPPALALASGLAASVWPAAIIRRKRAADLLRIL